MERESPQIAVFGSSVRDISVDIDLADLYRSNPKLRPLHFRDNDPALKPETVIRVLAGPTAFDFSMTLEAPAEKEKLVVKDVDGNEYYRLQGGDKYSLKDPVKQRLRELIIKNESEEYYCDDDAGKYNSIPSAEEKSKKIEANCTKIRTPDLELYCHSRTWGGGGMNLACAIRGMSMHYTTPITYLDSSRHLRATKWNDSLAKMITEADLSGPSIRNDLSALLGLLKEAKNMEDLVSNLSSCVAASILTVFENHIDQWLRKAGERGYRAFARFISSFDPAEFVDVFLSQQRIRFAMLREAMDPPPSNLVFTHVREGSRSIHDKIIFRGPKGNLPETLEVETIKKDISKEVPSPGLIVINSVYDAQLLFSALEWAEEIQENQLQQQKQQKTGDIDVICPVLIVLTPGNVKQLKTLPEFPKRLSNLCNLYVILNESEFCDYLKVHEPGRFSEFRKNVEAGFIPDDNLLKEAFQYFENILPHSHQRFIVTFGSLGSFGVANDAVRYVGTYALPGRTIYSTSGCGDTFSAGVALLIYHKHNHRWTDETNPRTLWRVDPSNPNNSPSELTVMMQVGSAAAYARATSPTASVTGREIVSLLEHAFIPTSDPVLLEKMPTKRFDQPPRAVRVGLPGILEKIFDA